MASRRKRFSFRDLIKDLGSGVAAVGEMATGGSTPPPQIRLTRQQLRSPRVRSAALRSQPLTLEAARAQAAVPEAAVRELSIASEKLPGYVQRASDRFVAPITDPLRANIPIIQKEVPVGKGARFLATEFAKFPTRIVGGPVSTAAAISEGKDLTEVLKPIGTTIEGAFDAFIPGAGKALAKAGFKQAKVPLRKSITKAAKQGAAVGGGTGLGVGLQQEAEDITDQFLNSLSSAAIGALAGSVLGAGVSGTGRLTGKALGKVKRELKESFRLIRKGNQYQVRRLRNTKFGKKGQFKIDRDSSQAGFIDPSAFIPKGLRRQLEGKGRRSAKAAQDVPSNRELSEIAQSPRTGRLLSEDPTIRPDDDLLPSRTTPVAGRKTTQPLEAEAPELVREAVPSRSLEDDLIRPSTPNRAINLAKGKDVNVDETILRQRDKAIKDFASQKAGALETDVSKKVGFHDLFRSPEYVYAKMGLGRAAEALRLSEIKTNAEIPAHVQQIREWVSRVGSARQEAVFDALDGAKVDLTPDEQIVVKEIREYLSTWADRLKLPKDRRIAHYITHIFEPDFIQKEFDPELAKLITDKVPGSVYDPFLERRLGKLGYKKDLGLALQAYAKRGIRKANFDPILEQLKIRSKNLELTQANYLKRNLARINMRPTTVDNMVDNTIKTMFGYRFGQRPTMKISQVLRTLGYRGTLGLNIGSAIKNLTQGVNTYAKLGEKYTLVGYAKVLRPGAREELERVGVLSSSFIDQPTASVRKQIMRRFDDALFFFFEKAEEINRGAAYFGAKQKALHAGKPLDEAIIDGLNMARKTQFTFGKVDTPEILSSDFAKFLGQFQSFNIKQAEFLAGMMKDKEFAGMVRWLAANTLLVSTIGQLINYDLEDLIPFSGIVTGRTKLGQTPAVRVGTTALQAAVGAPGRFGQPVDFDDVLYSLQAVIPGGVQFSKLQRGGLINPSGGGIKLDVNDPDIQNFFDQVQRRESGQSTIRDQEIRRVFENIRSQQPGATNSNQEQPATTGKRKVRKPSVRKPTTPQIKHRNIIKPISLEPQRRRLAAAPRFRDPDIQGFLTSINAV